MRKSDALMEKIGNLWARAAVLSARIHTFAAPLKARQTAVTVNQLKRACTQLQMNLCEAIMYDDEAKFCRTLEDGRGAAARVMECLYLLKTLELTKGDRVDNLMGDCQQIFAEISSLVKIPSDGRGFPD